MQQVSTNIKIDSKWNLKMAKIKDTIKTALGQINVTKIQNKYFIKKTINKCFLLTDNEEKIEITKPWYENEKKALKKLNELKKHEENEDKYIITMQAYLENNNWFRLKDITTENKKYILIKIIEQLKTLEKNKIIHGDISDTNILMNIKTGQIKIIDFGLCVFYDQLNENHQLKVIRYIPLPIELDNNIINEEKVNNTEKFWYPKQYDLKKAFIMLNFNYKSITTDSSAEKIYNKLTKFNQTVIYQDIFLLLIVAIHFNNQMIASIVAIVAATIISIIHWYIIQQQQTFKTKDFKYKPQVLDQTTPEVSPRISHGISNPCKQLQAKLGS